RVDLMRRRACWPGMALAGFVACCAALLGVRTAIAAPASLNHYVQSIDLPPFCPVSASDATVCQVAPAQSRPFQATSVEYILFRIGWKDAMKVSCDAYTPHTKNTL